MSTQPPDKTVQDELQEVREQLEQTREALVKTTRGLKWLWVCVAALLLFSLSNLPNHLPWRRYDTITTRELLIEGTRHVPIPGSWEKSYTVEPTSERMVLSYYQGEPFIGFRNTARRNQGIKVDAIMTTAP